MFQIRAKVRKIFLACSVRALTNTRMETAKRFMAATDEQNTAVLNHGCYPEIAAVILLLPSL